MYTVREYWYYCAASAIVNNASKRLIAGLMSNIAIDMILLGNYYG